MLNLLIEAVNIKACHYRNVLTVLQRPDFDKLYTSCTDKERQKVDEMAIEGSYEALRTWYRHKTHCDLGDKSLRELRAIASTLFIPNYASLKKHVLLSEIVKRKSNDPVKHADQNVS